MSGIQDGIRHNLLYRLRWNILADVENIEILTGTPDHATAVPLLGHPLADEALCEQTLIQVEMQIKNILDHIVPDFEEEEAEHQVPAPLTTVNEDGRSITLGQFVTEVHAYLNRNLEEIRKAKAVLYGNVITRGGRSEAQVIPGENTASLPDNIDLYFEQVWVMIQGEGFSLLVSIFADGELGCSIEKLWASQNKCLAQDA